MPQALPAATAAAQFFDRFFERSTRCPASKRAGAISFLPLTARRGDVDGDRRAAEAAAGPGARHRRARHHPALLRDDGHPAPARPRCSTSRTPPTPIAASSSTRRWRDSTGPARIRSASASHRWDDRRRTRSSASSATSARRARRRVPRPMTYWPYRAEPYGRDDRDRRTAGDPAGARRPARRRPRLDPRTGGPNVKTMDEVVVESVAQRRLTMLLLTIFAGAGAAAGGGRHLRRDRLQRHRSARRRSASGWRSARSAATCCAWSSAGARAGRPGSRSAVAARSCSRA